MRPIRVGALIAVTVLLAGACSDSDDATEPTTPDADATAPVEDSGAGDSAEDEAPDNEPAAEPADDTDTSDTASEVADLRTTLDERGVETLVLDPTTETGPHPTLSWQAVDGAASYWLVLLDGAGDPYWAWTGTATSIRVGGGDSAEENQTAVLYQPMTWTVSAFAADGELLAISETATVSP